MTDIKFDCVQDVNKNGNQNAWEFRTASWYFGDGCWQFGGDSNSYWGDQSQKDVVEVVSMALDNGINYFDTAEMYNDGESERSLGLALKGRRHKAIIGTKIKPSNTKSKTLREHCEASLRRMQTDYIDLYMLHWPINAQSILHFSNDESLIADPPTVEEVFHTLKELQQEGKVRYIGISNHGIEQMEEVRKTGVQVVANQLIYNLICRAVETEILPYCADHRIGVIGYMGLHQAFYPENIVRLTTFRKGGHDPDIFIIAEIKLPPWRRRRGNRIAASAESYSRACERSRRIRQHIVFGVGVIESESRDDNLRMPRRAAVKIKLGSGFVSFVACSSRSAKCNYSSVVA